MIPPAAWITPSQLYLFVLYHAYLSVHTLPSMTILELYTLLVIASAFAYPLFVFVLNVTREDTSDLT